MPEFGADIALLEGQSIVATMGSRPLIAVNGRGWPQIVNRGGLRQNSLLSGDEWRTMDEGVIQATRLRLRGVQDLISRGLTSTLGGLGTLVTQWSTVSEMTPAAVNMTGRHTPDGDRAEFGIAGVPVPIIHKEYEIGIRELEASRLGRNALDTTNGAAAAAVVAEKQEDILFNGYSLTFDGKSIYGYTNHPNRIADTVTNFGGGVWSTIANIVATVAGMIGAAKAKKFFGPYILYINTNNYNEAALAFYTDGTGQTPMERLMKLTGLSAIEESDFLDDGELVLVQMTGDVVDYAYIPKMMPANLEWTSGDGMINFFKVIAVGVPRIKTPQGQNGGKTGIVHATGA